MPTNPFEYHPIKEAAAPREQRIKYPRVMRICQNCLYGNNEKGKFFQDGWNIFCNAKMRWYRWNKRKLCYKFPLKEHDDE